MQVFAQPAQPANQRFAIRSRNIADRPEPDFVKADFGLWSDTPESRDRQVTKEHVDLVRLDDNESVRFANVGGNLCQELIRGKADGSRQTRLLANFILDRS